VMTTCGLLTDPKIMAYRNRTLQTPKLADYFVLAS
jgi:hypothetical protein